MLALTPQAGMAAGKAEQRKKNEELAQAVANSDIDAVKKLAAGGADVNGVVNPVTKERVLESALDSRDTEVLEYLIANKAQVNYKSFGSSVCQTTPLGKSVAKMNVDAVKVMLGAGASIDFAVKNSDSAYGPLLSCIDYHKKNAVEAASLLIKSGAKPEGSNSITDLPLILAVAAGNLKAVDLLLESGASPDAKARISEAPALGMLSAVKEPDRDALAKTLIAAKADVNARDTWGNTPLMLLMKNASQHDKGVAATAGLLLSAGARVNVRNKNGETALHLAMSQPEPVIRALLDAGADPELRDNSDKLPEDLVRSHWFNAEQLKVLLNSYKKK